MNILFRQPKCFFRHLPSFLVFTIMLLPACLFITSSSAAQTNSTVGVVLFWEDGFPSADTAPLIPGQADRLFAGMTRADSKTLASALNGAGVLVLPYGSAFPEGDWTAIEAFLQRGGNLVVLGGKPFARPAYQREGHWELRPETLAYSRALRIFGYQPTSERDPRERRTTRGLRRQTRTYGMTQGV